MVGFPVVEFTGNSVVGILIHSPNVSNHITRYRQIERYQLYLSTVYFLAMAYFHFETADEA